MQLHTDKKIESAEAWVEAFKEITDELIGLLSDLSEENLNQVPFAGSWSVGQVGDHLLKSYQIKGVLMGKTCPANRKADALLASIRKLFLDFTIKMEAPDFIIPTNEYIEQTTLVENIRNTVTELLALANQQDFDMHFICLDFELPETGTLTRLEWLGFMSLHTQRHVHQLNNIIKKLKDNR